MDFNGSSPIDEAIARIGVLQRQSEAIDAEYDVVIAEQNALAKRRALVDAELYFQKYRLFYLALEKDALATGVSISDKMNHEFHRRVTQYERELKNAKEL